MKKLAFLAAALAFVPSLVSVAPAFATSGGYLAGGPDIYQVRNVTKNTAYSSAASVACNETVKYSIKLSNTEYGLLSNVTVKAPLTGTMTATATNAANETVSTTGTVSVTAASGNFSYIAGSTQLYDVNGNLIKSLPDGVVSGGVNAGNLNGSTREFLQFQAKLNCETPPTPPKQIQVCELATKKIITIDEDKFDASKHSKDLSKCKEVPPTPKKIEVCELATKKIITIEESKFDASKHSKDLSKCKETPKQIQVCELATKKIVTINEADFNASKYSKNLNDCKETPVPGKIQVCEIATKKVITISEDAFDASKYSKDLNDCKEVPVTPTPETPEILPATGAGSIVAQVIGASSLTAAIAAFIRSRKLLG